MPVTCRPVVSVSPPANDTVAPLVVSTMSTVAALTDPLNVTPFEFATVTVPMSVPIAPVNDAPPVLLTVRPEAAPPAVPDTLDTKIAPLAPSPRVSVTPSDSLTAPRVSAPLLPSVTLCVNSVAPRFTAPVAVIVPPTVTCDGAVAVRLPLNVNWSADASPKTSVPVLLKVVSPAITLVDPVSDTL